VSAPACPRCDQPLDPVPSHNALTRAETSRSQERVYVCARCGLAEALWAREHPGATLPPLDRPVI
jgi:uncharacterized protein with PIN domain